MLRVTDTSEASPLRSLKELEETTNDLESALEGIEMLRYILVRLGRILSNLSVGVELTVTLCCRKRLQAVLLNRRINMQFLLWAKDKYTTRGSMVREFDTQLQSQGEDFDMEKM